MYLMIHVVTAVHNRIEITEKFVERLKGQTYKNIHLILVDDGSTDGTAEMVKTNFPRSTILRGNGNLWWGGALHLAYKYISRKLRHRPEDYILLTNDDVIYESDYLKKGIQILKGRKKTLLAGRIYDEITGKISFPLYKYDYSDKHGSAGKRTYKMEGEYCSTNSLFMRVGDFIDIGGFHPVLLPHYGSDYEWTYRAFKKGYHIISDKSLVYKCCINTTGYNFYEDLTLKKMFSKKSVVNPFYKINFILLTTPVRYIPREIGKQLGRYFGKLDILRDTVHRSRKGKRK